MFNQHAFTLIHWSGPFTFNEIMNSEVGEGKGLYLMTGKQEGDDESQIQYLGISETKYNYRFSGHHKLPYIREDLEIWLGEIVSTPFPARNGAYQAYLKEPERLLTYYLQPPLNEKNTKLSPAEPQTVINYWFDTKGKPRERRKYIAQKGLEDVVSWDGENWRTGNLDFFPDDE